MSITSTPLPQSRLMVDRTVTLVLPNGERLPAEFHRDSLAFSALDGLMHAPHELLTEQTPLGTALRLQCRSGEPAGERAVARTFAAGPDLHCAAGT